MSENKKIDNGGPAIPSEQLCYVEGFGWNQTLKKGMTLRDWFAGMVIQGIFASMPTTTWEPKEKSKDVIEAITKIAFYQADAMVRARKE